MNDRVATDPRISRRRKAVARSKRRAMITRVAAATAISVGLWAVFFSPLLAVRDIDVLGARHITPTDVARIAELGPTDNLLLLSTDEVARRVERLPWVKRASVDRRLPGTVRVRITERRPALALSVGAARWTIDRSGRILQAGAPAGLPTLAGMEVADIRPGVELEAAEVSSALRVFSAMPGRIRRHAAAVFAPSTERITVSLQDGTQVRYGADRRLRAKNEVIAALLRRLAAAGTSAAYIDVRVPANPAVSTAPAAPEIGEDFSR